MQCVLPMPADDGVDFIAYGVTPEYLCFTLWLFRNY